MKLKRHQLTSYIGWISKTHSVIAHRRAKANGAPGVRNVHEVLVMDTRGRSKWYPFSEVFRPVL